MAIGGFHNETQGVPAGRPTTADERGTDSRVARKLSSLIHFGFDAVAAYEVAIARLYRSRHQEQLREFAADLRAHIGELSQCVRDLGALPPPKGDARGYFLKGMVWVASIAGDRAILRALRSQEHHAANSYERLLAQLAGASAKVRRTVEQCLADVRRHHAWLDGQLTK